MKMKKEHFEHLKAEINKVLDINPEIIDAYQSGNFHMSEKVKNLQIRFNYDLFYAAIPSRWVVDNLSPYLNDAHIDTALRNICPKIVRLY